MALRLIRPRHRFEKQQYQESRNHQSDVMRQTDVRIRILVDDLPEKVSSYVICGALVQK